MTDLSPCSLDHKINAAVRRTVRLLQNGVFCWRILGEEAKLERRILHNMLKLLALPRGQRQANKDNHLAESGTPKHSTGSFGFLPRVSHQGATRESRSPDCVSRLTFIITPALRGAGRFETRLGGDDRVLCVSRTPFLTAARKLVAQGYDPGITLILRHAGSDTDSLRAKLGAHRASSVEL